MDTTNRIKQTFSFATGVVRRKELIYLAFTDDRANSPTEPHFLLGAWYQGEWIVAGGRPWPAVAADVSLDPVPQMVVIGPLGEVVFSGSDDDHDETVASGEVSPRSHGNLRALRAIDGKAHVAGMGRQVYRRDSRDQWTLLTSDEMWPGDEVRGFEAIDGFSSNDLYAVGWGGEIWHYDGSQWHQIDSPTGSILTDVCCAGDGQVYACGRSGLVLRGRGAEWVVLDQKHLSADFWSMRWFRGQLYLSGPTGVFRLDENGEIDAVDFGDDTPGSAYQLTACDDALVSIGAKDIMMFDGESWTRIA